ncbi:lactococcin G-beta/enterocin 1071B family bacteriocin [Clostridium sp. L74]|uniref:lactococcin G-beta/enterocin 1071B family bacteriocin n=1 Tax=Clostridium sp. L74 TaxID=1560217 RepID=UPI0006C04C5D|nr:lactococcin G-beta/enterocin 1071B family bacteriocin [Clostridium sp. L74]KOR25289.1 hypothetical protein ND00_18380 [Clostridium sp. L74]
MEIKEFEQLNENELVNIDGGFGPKDLIGLAQPLYDLGYGIGYGFAKTAKRL